MPLNAPNSSCRVVGKNVPAAPDGSTAPLRAAAVGTVWISGGVFIGVTNHSRYSTDPQARGPYSGDRPSWAGSAGIDGGGWQPAGLPGPGPGGSPRLVVRSGAGQAAGGAAAGGAAPGG